MKTRNAAVYRAPVAQRFQNLTVKAYAPIVAKHAHRIVKTAPTPAIPASKAITPLTTLTALAPLRSVSPTYSDDFASQDSSRSSSRSNSPAYTEDFYSDDFLSASSSGSSLS